MPNCFATSEKGYFVTKVEPTYQKTLNWSKKPCFLVLKNKKGFTSILKQVKNIANSGIRTRNFCLPNRGDAHTFELIKVLKALQ